MATILITGSGRRIGRALAIKFAEKKYDVIVHYNNSKEKAFDTVKEIQLLGCKAVAVKADVRNESEIISAFEQGMDKLGMPEILVNNAGIFPEAKPLQDISLGLWDDTMNTNLRSEFLFAKIFAKYAGKGSKIINIASLGGIEIWKNRIPYNVSKSAVIQLTKALARELAPDISVNCINPGAILIEDDISKTDTTLIDINKIPMKRFGSVQDIFDAVYFFATASSYITGQVLTVDGGYHLSR